MTKHQLDVPVELVAGVAPLAPFNSAVSAVAASAVKTEDRRQNLPHFMQKPMTQTIPVKLPDNIVELLKGQARQRGISLQTLIKSTLTASVATAVAIAEEQS
jgi:hypothetical protein